MSVIHLRVADSKERLNHKLKKLSGIERIVYPEHDDEPLKMYAKDANAVLSQIIDIITPSGVHLGGA